MAMGGGGGGYHGSNGHGGSSSDQHLHHSYYPQQQQVTSSQRDRQQGMDRRRVFAKMKYGVHAQHNNNNMPPPTKVGSGTSNHGHGGMPAMSQHSYGDGMPDIHMVESTMSLLSNMSTMTEGNSMITGASNVVKREEKQEGSSGKDIPVRPPFAQPSLQQPEVVQLKDHSRDIHWGGLLSGSRHSVMSGLSRIDDHSLVGSVFSDTSGKKNNSTRSIAMSEISVLDMQCMQERENEDDDSDRSFGHRGDGSPVKAESRPSAPVEYDL